MFTRKYDAHGNVLFKVHLVARGFRGFTQIPGLDHHETFSSTLKLTSLHLIFAITTCLNLELYHIGIERVFLHGDPKEEIYMKQPKLSKDTLHPNYVCKLHKPLYGLK